MFFYQKLKFLTTPIKPQHDKDQSDKEDSNNNIEDANEVIITRI